MNEETVLEVNEDWPEGGLTGLDYEVLPGSVAFQGLTKGTWASGTYLKPKINASDSQNFNLEIWNSAETVLLEKVYNMDRSNVVSYMSSESSYFSATVQSNRLEPVPGTSVNVTGGDDGYTGILDGDYIGNSPLETGIYSFKI